MVGAEVWIKFENHQFTASFKERGALNRLLALNESERKRGVVAVSAGNHAQGVAYHAARLGIPATIVMPEHTPFVKVRHTRDFGATVELAGSSVDEAFEYGHSLETNRDLVFVHPFDDPYIIAGQGTVGLEMLEDRSDLDVLLVPVGGGGLIGGMSIAARSMKPDIEIIGVQTEAYPFAYQKFYKQELTAPSAPIATIAEGIAVKSPGNITSQLIREFVDRMILVGERELEKGVSLLASIEKTIAEGAGAAALAALLHPEEKSRLHGKKIGIVLSGGNIDDRILAFILLRNLVREGRLVRMRIEIQDNPGELARISGLVASCGGNIVDVEHHRIFSALSIRSADLDLTVETRDAGHKDEMLESIRKAGFRVRILED